ncbi:MAG: hypothetical protein MJ237_08195 [bacterium]|nr:hypothetical protein [bacterium]
MTNNVNFKGTFSLKPNTNKSAELFDLMLQKKTSVKNCYVKINKSEATNIPFCITNIPLYITTSNKDFEFCQILQDFNKKYKNAFSVKYYPSVSLSQKIKDENTDKNIQELIDRVNKINDKKCEISDIKDISENVSETAVCTLDIIDKYIRNLIGQKVFSEKAKLILNVINEYRQAKRTLKSEQDNLSTAKNERQADKYFPINDFSADIIVPNENQGMLDIFDKQSGWHIYAYPKTKFTHPKLKNWHLMHICSFGNDSRNNKGIQSYTLSVKDSNYSVLYQWEPRDILDIYGFTSDKKKMNEFILFPHYVQKSIDQFKENHPKINLRTFSADNF